MNELLDDHNKYVKVFCHRATLSTNEGCNAIYYPVVNHLKTDDGMIIGKKCMDCGQPVFTTNETIYLGKKTKVRVSFTGNEELTPTE